MISLIEVKLIFLIVIITFDPLRLDSSSRALNIAGTRGGVMPQSCLRQLFIHRFVIDSLTVVV